MSGLPAQRWKAGECGGGEEAGTRGWKEGGDGEERVREGSIGGRPERNREKKASEVQVSAGSSGEDRSIGKGERHCERYELKIDYVAMDQVCTWSHY